MIRSLVFTALLNLDPAFGRLDTVEGSKVVTEAVAWLETHPEHQRDTYEGVKAFLAGRAS